MIDDSGFIVGEIHATAIDKELANKLHRLLEETRKVQEELRRKFVQSPEYQAMQTFAASSIAGSGGYGANNLSWQSSNRSLLEYKFKPRQPLAPLASLNRKANWQSFDPKTLNLLLSGKLLTDSQKRDLLRGKSLQEIMDDADPNVASQA